MQRPKPAVIDRATALRYMGAAGWQPDAAAAALLDKAEVGGLQVRVYLVLPVGAAALG